jgi:hypothetical protein
MNKIRAKALYLFFKPGQIEVLPVIQTEKLFAIKTIR